MSTPVATERKSFLPLRLRSTTVVGSSNIPIVSRPTTPVATSMPSGAHNDSKLLFTVGDRVLVNGIKIGNLRYVGTVKFAPGLFYGVELDDPEGKHDGQVNDFRYFQCKTNHGVFVPYDKVVLAPRERILSTNRSISRLKPPTITRALTISSSIHNKTEQIPNRTSSTQHVQLPDIIPSPSNPTQPIPIIKPIIDPVMIDDYETMTPTEEPRIILKPIIQPQLLPIDEPAEPIEADFTDSISLILHQLQPNDSLTISEGSFNNDDDDEDDGEDDDTDDIDSESVTGSSISEKIQMRRRSSSINNSTKSVQTDLSFDINDNMLIFKNNLLDSRSLSNSNKSLANSNTSINKLKLNTTENKVNIHNKRLSIPTSVPLGRKETERKTTNTIKDTSITSRRLSLIPAKKGSTSMIRQNAINSSGTLNTQSKLNHSLSSTNSIDDNHTESEKPLKISVKPALSMPRTTAHSADKNSSVSCQNHDALNHELMIQKIVIQSLETSNEQFKNQYQHLLNQFDILCVLSQYYITENEQMKQHYEFKLSKIQLASNQSKTLIEQIQTSHKNQLVTLDEQYQNQTGVLKELHQQQSMEYQEHIDKLSNEKFALEVGCKSLQEQVDRFMEEMANSEHADPLLRRVEILEKDRTSLQTVLEIKTQDLTQLRTKINEQVFQREDQLALQKRIDMAENRNQDLVCLLRNWQLNEKAVTVERDQLKEQLAQLERDNRQLTFENETLQYRLHQRSSLTSQSSTFKFNLSSSSTRTLLDRAHSLSSIMAASHESECLTRSLSLNNI